jgi:long-chain acyl-CoA synthetase
MTETSPLVSSAPANGNKRGTIGLPVAGTEIKIVDEEGNALGVDQPGELCVRGPQVMLGYWNRPDATAETIDSDGWLYTGDVAQVGEDGYMRIVDRKKNIIRRSGENIAAAEVEEALIENSKVKSVAVLAAKDEFHDEEIHACIVLMPNKEASKATAKSIFDFGRNKLITYKLPGWISFVDQIPVTGTQKIRKDAIFPKDFNLIQDVNSFDMRTFKRKKVVINE